MPITATLKLPLLHYFNKNLNYQQSYDLLGTSRTPYTRSNNEEEIDFSLLF
jgi:hypothetical protein